MIDNILPQMLDMFLAILAYRLALSIRGVEVCSQVNVDAIIC